MPSATLSGAASALVLGYDNDGLMTTVGGLTASRGTTVGLLKSLTRPGLDGETFTYDGYGAPLTMLATYNGAAKGGLTLTFDALTGQVHTKAEAWAFAPISPPTKTWTYTYDSANRLETANDGTLHTYTYDANGNRAGSTVDAQDRVTSQTDNGITTTYTYDAHGNVQVRTVTNLPTQSFTWDSEGSLLSSTQPSATVTYVIDALGRRVGRKVGGVLNREWVYDGQLRIVGEYIGATKVRLYGYLPERHLPVMMVEKDGATTKTYRIYGDHLGSLRAVVDVATGNAVQVMQHDPWGKATETLSGGFVRVPFGFAGGIYDEDTKLVRFGAREYDPETGRWLSKDEARFGGGWNFYEYAISDPVNWIDLNGRGPIQFGKCLASGKSFAECWDDEFDRLAGFGGGPPDDPTDTPDPTAAEICSQHPKGSTIRIQCCMHECDYSENQCISTAVAQCLTECSAAPHVPIPAGVVRPGKPEGPFR